MDKKPVNMSLPADGGSGSIPDGIFTLDGKLLLPGLSNSFMLYDSVKFWMKYRYLWFFISITLLQTLLYFSDFQVVGFGKGDGIADFTKISIDMGGFASRRRSSEIIEIDEVFGNQYVVDKKKVIDPSITNVISYGGSDDGADYGDGDGGGGFGGALDLDFRPEIKAPRLLTSLRKVYPASAREINVEAKLMTEVIIAPDGAVKWVKVVWISLSKELPRETTVKLKKEFYSAAHQILLGAHFTPAVFNGQAIMVRMVQPLNFVLE